MPLNKTPTEIDRHLQLTMPILCALLANRGVINAYNVHDDPNIKILVKRSQEIADILLTVIDEES